MTKLLLSILSIAVIFQVASAQSLQNVVVEEHTGAWCGYCPEGADILEDILASNPNAIGVSIHDGDQMYVPTGGVIANFYGPAYPQATINRNSGPISRGSWTNAVNVASQVQPQVYVSFDSVAFDYSSRILTVRVRANFVQAMTGQFRFNVYLVENEMSGTGTGWDQVNYFNGTPGHNYYQAGNPIPNYVHKHVFRDALGGAWGTPAIIPGTVNPGETYYHTYTKYIGTNIEANDLALVAMVNLHGGQTVSSRPTLNSEEMQLALAIGIEDGIGANSDLMEVYPNPAADRVSIAYTVETLGMITLEVRNQLGQHVRTLGHDMMNPGAHTYVWDGNDAQGRPVADGLYLVRMLTESGQSLTKRVIINR